MAIDIVHVINPMGMVLKDASGNSATFSDTSSGKTGLDVNIVGGNVYLDATFSDIQIGAVEIKDGNSDLRAKVQSIDGTAALSVTEASPVFLSKSVLNVFTDSTLTPLFAESSSINCSDHGQSVFDVSYDKGLEDSFEFKFQFSHDSSSWFDQVAETLGSSDTSTTQIVPTSKVYKLTNSADLRISVPLSDMYLRMSIKGVGASTDGTVSSNVTLGWN